MRCGLFVNETPCVAGAGGVPDILRTLFNSGVSVRFGDGIIAGVGQEEARSLGLFGRWRRRRSGGGRAAKSEDVEYLRSWAQRRRGVEGYLEPRTTMTETTLVLIAHDGEWTRRRVNGLSAAQRFARRNNIPFYEVTKTGYPQRMRDYQARQRILRDKERKRRLGGDTGLV
jgi:hypothetical protein